MPEVAPASSTTPSILVRKLRCFRGRHWRKAPPGAIEYQVSHSLRRPHEATGLPGRVLRHPCNYLDVLIADRDRQKSSLLTLRWREPDSNHRSRRKRDGRRERPRGRPPSSREPAMVGRGASLDGRLFFGGTDGSNPVPSSGESATNCSWRWGEVIVGGLPVPCSQAGQP